MRSSVVVLATLGCAAAGACTDDAALLVYVSGSATEPMDLVPSFDGIPAKQGSYRWELIEAPARSGATDPVGTKMATFQPDLRGRYLVERWLTYGIGEDLTHRFVIDVTGIPPFASIRADSVSVVVETTVSIDGSNSNSFEGLTLSYHWRLAARPPGSSATISDDAATTTLVPDTAGDYVIELSVFDGELWSDPGTLTVVATP